MGERDMKWTRTDSPNIVYEFMLLTAALAKPSPSHPPEPCMLVGQMERLN